MPSVTLAQLRDQARRRADMLGTQFVSDAELNDLINHYARELYDKLVENDPSYAVTYQDISVTSGNTIPVPTELYKFRGIDLTDDGENFFTVQKMGFLERGRFNNAALRYGRCARVRYRYENRLVYLLPAESAPASYRLWFVPYMTALVVDGSLFDGQNGFELWVVLKAARAMIAKEEGDTKEIDVELFAVNKRLEAMAKQDESEPTGVTDVRSRRTNDHTCYDDEE